MTEREMHVVIVGGGFSGAMTALHILRECRIPVTVTICEPRRQLGRGLAYSTACKQHLLNVPAAGMSAFPDDPDHFVRYAQAVDPSIRETTFAPRELFGQYIGAQLDAIVSSAAEQTLKLEHVEAEVVGIKKTNQGWAVSVSTGVVLEADCVVLALGNLVRKRPRWCAALVESDATYVHDPWELGGIDSIEPADEVLLVGTGLTAVDKIIELHQRGHTGKIYALSRHGLFPAPHVERLLLRSKPAEAKAGSVLDTLSSLRHQVARIAKEGKAEEWRLVFDGLRSGTQEWWQSLPVTEQKRFLRHLRTYFDVHRHRMAPEIARIIQTMKSSGQLMVLAGRITSVSNFADNLDVTIRIRGTDTGFTLIVDKIVNCTGACADIDATESSLLRQLVVDGVAGRSDLETGLSVTATGQILASDGSPADGLFAVGPLLQGKLLESIAVPELRSQTQELAKIICGLLCSKTER